nr:alpha/beta hydrolase [Mycolicibacterium komanii]
MTWCWSRIRWPVICTDDRVVNPDWSRRMAHDLDADVIEIGGGHSPFLSRPQALAEVLLEIARRN